MKLHHSCFIINRVVADTTSEEGRQRGPWEGFLVLVDLRMTGKRKNRYVKAIVKVDQKFLCFCYHGPKRAISRKLKELRGDIWYGKSCPRLPGHSFHFSKLGLWMFRMWTCFSCSRRWWCWMSCMASRTLSVQLWSNWAPDGSSSVSPSPISSTAAPLLSTTETNSGAAAPPLDYPLQVRHLCLISR